MPDERPTRRRDEVLLNAIREATRQELGERNYDGVSFEGVARRARTSKPVLYRRYRSRAHMVADALGEVALASEPLTTTGSLRADMLSVLTAQLARFHEFGIATYRGVLGEADDELMDEIVSASSDFARKATLRMLGEARERGEIGPVEIPDRAVMTPLALLRHELFISRDTVSTDSLAELLDTVILPLFSTLSRRAEQVP